MAKSIKNAAFDTEAPATNRPLNGEKTFRRQLRSNKLVQVLEIATVFSPVLALILGFRIAGLKDPMLMIGGIWVSYLVMFGLIWYSVRLRGESSKSIGLVFEMPTLSSTGWTVLKSLAVFIFAAAAFIFGSIVMANITGIPEDADLTRYNFLSGNLPLLLISLPGVYLVSSFGEEVVFRGFLINRVQELFGGKTRSAIIAAVLVSSLVFGFAHFEWGAMGIVQTTFMGAALGVSFLLNKKRLGPLILAHCYMDTLLLVPLYFAPA